MPESKVAVTMGHHALAALSRGCMGQEASSGPTTMGTFHTATSGPLPWHCHWHHPCPINAKDVCRREHKGHRVKGECECGGQVGPSRLAERPIAWQQGVAAMSCLAVCMGPTPQPMSALPQGAPPPPPLGGPCLPPHPIGLAKKPSPFPNPHHLLQPDDPR